MPTYLSYYLIAMVQFQEAFSKVKIVSSVIIGTVILFVILFIGSFFTIIEAGEVGVLSTFGKIDETPLSSGFHFKNPFSQVTKMNIRTHSYTMSGTYSEGEVQGDDSIQALGADGGSVWFDVTVLYRLKEESAPTIYKNLGLGYEINIVRPEIRSIIREVAARYTVGELYGVKREEFNNVVFDQLKESLDLRGLVAEEVLLRRVSISESLSRNIELKLAAEQEVQRLEFEIQKADKEAERQRVEARGQRDAQAIINESLSDKYLMYIYVQNLQNREGTIYVPTEGGVPLFKGI
jgi:regulator of protease activity HflC (stomatin/prohibitin superfamily)